MNKKIAFIIFTFICALVILNMGIIYTPGKQLKLELSEEDISKSRAQLLLWR